MILRSELSLAAMLPGWRWLLAAQRWPSSDQQPSSLEYGVSPVVMTSGRDAPRCTYSCCVRRRIASPLRLVL